MVDALSGIEPEVIELILQRKYFYGHLLQQFRRHCFDSKSTMGKVIRTMGVNVTNDLQPNLFINTDFYNSGDYDPANPTKQTWGLSQEETFYLCPNNPTSDMTRDSTILTSTPCSFATITLNICVEMRHLFSPSTNQIHAIIIIIVAWWFLCIHYLID